jgi:hypothetical protein
MAPDGARVFGAGRAVVGDAAAAFNKGGGRRLPYGTTFEGSPDADSIPSPDTMRLALDLRRVTLSFILWLHVFLK